MDQAHILIFRNEDRSHVGRFGRGRLLVDERVWKMRPVWLCVMGTRIASSEHIYAAGERQEVEEER